MKGKGLEMSTGYEIFPGDCLEWLEKCSKERFHLSFVDPPFNQGKDYRCFDDNLSDKQYWDWIKRVLSGIYDSTVPGGSVYFMQREKNTEPVLRTLRETGWIFRNLIVWKKKASAVPCSVRFGKHYQIIAFATKGEKPRVFNRLRISPPLPKNYKTERKNGVYVTDIWDDIRELTSGYFAGNEAIRNSHGKRFHKQQAPISLLLRIILSSTYVGDTVFDPFAGTGTTLVTAYQLQRNSVGTEIDPENVRCIQDRLSDIRNADTIKKYYDDYTCTNNLDEIWGSCQMTVPKSEQFV